MVEHICWKCKRGALDCEWFNHIDGGTKNAVPNGAEYKENKIGIKIISCPNYIEDERLLTLRERAERYKDGEHRFYYEYYKKKRVEKTCQERLTNR